MSNFRCAIFLQLQMSVSMTVIWIFYIMFIYVSTVYLQSPMPPLYVCATQWHMNATQSRSRDVGGRWGNVGRGRGTSVEAGEH